VRRLSVPIGAQGAIVSVEIGVSTPLHKALLQARQNPPAGALNLSPRNRYRFHSATTSTHSPQACAAYDVSLALGSAAAQNLWRIDAIEVMGSEEPRSHGLLGRDVLERLQFEWHGPRREMVLLYV
jgi:hypothetical protein